MLIHFLFLFFSLFTKVDKIDTAINISPSLTYYCFPYAPGPYLVTSYTKEHKQKIRINATVREK